MKVNTWNKGDSKIKYRAFREKAEQDASTRSATNFDLNGEYFEARRHGSRWALSWDGGTASFGKWDDLWMKVEEVAGL